LKIGRNNLLFAVVVAVPMVAVALFSPGPYAGRLLLPGLVVLTLGFIVFLSFCRKGRNADREFCDEREDHIVSLSLRVTFLVTALVIHWTWAWNFALHGNSGDVLFPVLVAFWGSFLVSYLYYRLKT
jgi:hypothetical protein